MRQITQNVYIEDQFSVPSGINPNRGELGDEASMLPPYRGSNHSFITTSDGIVMIDSPMFPTDMSIWKLEISKRGKLRYLINTDSHTDHVTGNCAYTGIVVSSQGVRERFPKKPSEHNVRTIEEYDPAGRLLLEYLYPRLPTITFEEKLTLYCGEHTFECYHLPGHQQIHIGIYVPQEKVFFSGDNVTYKTQPSMAQCNPLGWIESLKFINSLDIDWVVGGHGPAGPKSAVTEMQQFIQTCIDMTRDAIKKGMSKKETVETLSFENLTGPAVHPGPGTQRRNVERLYDMLST